MGVTLSTCISDEYVCSTKFGGARDGVTYSPV